jgi:thioredoxin reductase
MTYAEKPFPSDAPAFPFRTQILKYLQEYGDEIRYLVNFNTEVLKVEKHGKWTLTIRDLKEPSKKPWIEKFDAVAVASGKTQNIKDRKRLMAGHYDIPLIPDIPGIKTFPSKKISHAKYFRHPSTYKGQNVLLVGNGPSGADLANQLLHHANSVQRSVRSEPNALAITNPKVRDISPIKCFHDNSIEFLDGSILSNIDKVIFCTGYLYSLPMFPKESGFITPDGLYVHHLYDQTFYCEDPTLVFLGLPKQVIPFPTFQNQAIVVTKVWARKLPLPSREVMRKEELLRLQQKMFDGSKYHSFKFPEDVELAEHWRKWSEMDNSEGCERSMKPWRWTEERVEYRKAAPKEKAKFLGEIESGKWDHLQLHKA